ncbi:uncharacterized protein LOC125776587 [Bactrocera dorsalis]|uniref:Uncharacterized protein LOC125776587 n=1 Tax=Bactrocera dorsalis TaxID=27457 RepID=A0ABM3J8N6_BACDO|nr:uncharacterized protein LOC125776587 [Bactrocera dorsalis]
MTRMDDIEKTLKENVIDKGLLLAQTHTLRKCKVVLAKVHHSIGRLVGEIENPMQIEIASRLPICTLDAALDFEDKLNSKEFADETKIHLQQIKGANASVDEVMRKIFTDNVLFEFSFDGRKQKRALNKLKLVNEVLFGSQD